MKQENLIMSYNSSVTIQGVKNKKMDFCVLNL